MARTRRVVRPKARAQNIWKATQPLVLEMVFKPLIAQLMASGVSSRRAIKRELETQFKCQISGVTFTKIMRDLGYISTKAEVRFEPIEGRAPSSSARLSRASLFRPASEVAKPSQTPDEIAAEVGFDVPGASPSSPPSAGAAVLDPALLGDGPPEPLPPAVLAAIAQGQRRGPRPVPSDENVFDQ